MDTSISEVSCPMKIDYSMESRRSVVSSAVSRKSENAKTCSTGDGTTASKGSSSIMRSRDHFGSSQNFGANQKDWRTSPKKHNLSSMLDELELPSEIESDHIGDHRAAPFTADSQDISFKEHDNSQDFDTVVDANYEVSQVALDASLDTNHLALNTNPDVSQMTKIDNSLDASRLGKIDDNQILHNSYDKIPVVESREPSIFGDISITNDEGTPECQNIFAGITSHGSDVVTDEAQRQDTEDIHRNDMDKRDDNIMGKRDDKKNKCDSEGKRNSQGIGDHSERKHESQQVELGPTVSQPTIGCSKDLQQCNDDEEKDYEEYIRENGSSNGSLSGSDHELASVLREQFPDSFTKEKCDKSTDKGTEDDYFLAKSAGRNEVDMQQLADQICMLKEAKRREESELEYVLELRLSAEKALEAVREERSCIIGEVVNENLKLNDLRAKAIRMAETCVHLREIQHCENEKAQHSENEKVGPGKWAPGRGVTSPLSHKTPPLSHNTTCQSHSKSHFQGVGGFSKDSVSSRQAKAPVSIPDAEIITGATKGATTKTASYESGREDTLNSSLDSSGRRYSFPTTMGINPRGGKDPLAGKDMEIEALESSRKVSPTPEDQSTASHEQIVALQDQSTLTVLREQTAALQNPSAALEDQRTAVQERIPPQKPAPQKSDSPEDSKVQERTLQRPTQRTSIPTPPQKALTHPQRSSIPFITTEALKPPHESRIPKAGSPKRNSPQPGHPKKRSTVQKTQRKMNGDLKRGRNTTKGNNSSMIDSPLRSPRGVEPVGSSCHRSRTPVHVPSPRRKTSPRAMASSNIERKRKNLEADYSLVSSPVKSDFHDVEHGTRSMKRGTLEEMQARSDALRGVRGGIVTSTAGVVSPTRNCKKESALRQPQVSSKGGGCNDKLGRSPPREGCSQSYLRQTQSSLSKVSNPRMMEDGDPTVTKIVAEIRKKKQLPHEDDLDSLLVPSDTEDAEEDSGTPSVVRTPLAHITPVTHANSVTHAIPSEREAQRNPFQNGANPVNTTSQQISQDTHGIQQIRPPQQAATPHQQVHVSQRHVSEREHQQAHADQSTQGDQPYQQLPTAQKQDLAVQTSGYFERASEGSFSRHGESEESDETSSNSSDESSASSEKTSTDIEDNASLTSRENHVIPIKGGHRHESVLQHEDSTQYQQNAQRSVVTHGGHAAGASEETHERFPSGNVSQQANAQRVVQQSAAQQNAAPKSGVQQSVVSQSGMQQTVQQSGTNSGGQSRNGVASHRVVNQVVAQQAVADQTVPRNRINSATQRDCVQITMNRTVCNEASTNQASTNQSTYSSSREASLAREILSRYPHLDNTSSTVKNPPAAPTNLPAGTAAANLPTGREATTPLNLSAVPLIPGVGNHRRTGMALSPTSLGRSPSETLPRGRDLSIGGNSKRTHSLGDRMLNIPKLQIPQICSPMWSARMGSARSNSQNQHALKNYGQNQIQNGQKYAENNVDAAINGQQQSANETKQMQQRQDSLNARRGVAMPTVGSHNGMQNGTQSGQADAGQENATKIGTEQPMTCVGSKNADSGRSMSKGRMVPLLNFDKLKPPELFNQGKAIYTPLLSPHPTSFRSPRPNSPFPSVHATPPISPANPERSQMPGRSQTQVERLQQQVVAHLREAEAQKLLQQQQEIETRKMMLERQQKQLEEMKRQNEVKKQQMKQHSESQKYQMEKQQQKFVQNANAVVAGVRKISPERMPQIPAMSMQQAVQPVPSMQQAVQPVQHMQQPAQLAQHMQQQVHVAQPIHSTNFVQQPAQQSQPVAPIQSMHAQVAQPVEQQSQVAPPVHSAHELRGGCQTQKMREAPESETPKQKRNTDLRGKSSKTRKPKISSNGQTTYRKSSLAQRLRFEDDANIVVHGSESETDTQQRGFPQQFQRYSRATQQTRASKVVQNQNFIQNDREIQHGHAMIHQQNIESQPQQNMQCQQDHKKSIQYHKEQKVSQQYEHVNQQNDNVQHEQYQNIHEQRQNLQYHQHMRHQNVNNQNVRQQYHSMSHQQQNMQYQQEQYQKQNVNEIYQNMNRSYQTGNQRDQQISHQHQNMQTHHVNQHQNMQNQHQNVNQQILNVNQQIVNVNQTMPNIHYQQNQHMRNASNYQQQGQNVNQEAHNMNQHVDHSNQGRQNSDEHTDKSPRIIGCLRFPPKANDPYANLKPMISRPDWAVLLRRGITQIPAATPAPEMLPRQERRLGTFGSVNAATSNVGTPLSVNSTQQMGMNNTSQRSLHSKFGDSSARFPCLGGNRFVSLGLTPPQPTFFPMPLQQQKQHSPANTQQSLQQHSPMPTQESPVQHTPMPTQENLAHQQIAQAIHQSAQPMPVHHGSQQTNFEQVQRGDQQQVSQCGGQQQVSCRLANHSVAAGQAPGQHQPSHSHNQVSTSQQQVSRSEQQISSNQQSHLSTHEPTVVHPPVHTQSNSSVYPSSPDLNRDFSRSQLLNTPRFGGDRVSIGTSFSFGNPMHYARLNPQQ